MVKEILENSLDAGADRIELDIEQGGVKLIRLRDNGSGIEKEDLSLALSRHATSKIRDLNDLEAVQSLGFRGSAGIGEFSVAADPDIPYGGSGECLAGADRRPGYGG